MAPKNSTKTTLALERRRRAWAMKVAGFGTHRDIAEKLGVSVGRVSQYLSQTMHELRQQNLNDAREWCELELQRLEKLQAAYWASAVGYKAQDGTVVKPSKRDADIVLRIMKQRTELLKVVGGRADVEVAVTSSSVNVYLPDNGRLAGVTH